MIGQTSDVKAFGRPEDIDISPYEYPGWANEKHYDAVLLYCSGDSERALLFKQTIENCVTLKDGKKASICVLDSATDISYVTGRFSALEEAIKRSTFLFMYITNNLLKNHETEAKWLRNQALVEVLENIDHRWCLVPIFAEHVNTCNFKIPFGMRALRGINLSNMTPEAKWFNEINRKDVDILTSGIINKSIKTAIISPLNSKLDHRYQREREQKKKVNAWLDEERLVRWKEQGKEIRRLEIQKAERAKTQAAYLADLDQSITAEDIGAQKIINPSDTRKILDEIRFEIYNMMRDGVSFIDINKHIEVKCRNYKSDIREKAVSFLIEQISKPQPGDTRPGNQVVIIQNANTVNVGDSTAILEQEPRSAAPLLRCDSDVGGGRSGQKVKVINGGMESTFNVNNVNGLLIPEETWGDIDDSSTIYEVREYDAEISQSPSCGSEGQDLTTSHMEVNDTNEKTSAKAAIEEDIVTSQIILSLSENLSASTTFEKELNLSTPQSCNLNLLSEKNCLINARISLSDLGYEARSITSESFNGDEETSPKRTSWRRTLKTKLGHLFKSVNR